MKEVTRAIIINEKGEVLVGKRARGKGVNLWAIIGGKVDLNETPEKCVVREVEEELGVTFLPTLYKVQIDTDDPETIWKVYYYVGKIRGEIKLKADENGEAKYVTKQDVETLQFAFGHEKILKDFFENYTPS